MSRRSRPPRPAPASGAHLSRGGVAPPLGELIGDGRWIDPEIERACRRTWLAAHLHRAAEVAALHERIAFLERGRDSLSHVCSEQSTVLEKEQRMREERIAALETLLMGVLSADEDAWEQAKAYVDRIPRAHRGTLRTIPNSPAE